ncbi:hypothetical protein QZH41_011901 [Actinostola sp. cb2023]|nr:hypothetical protein QZH41_011901 [Actinostola sp. cb2023]
MSLKTKPSLVAVSPDVVQDVLDIDSDLAMGSDSFLQFASGNALAGNSIPIAHVMVDIRYIIDHMTFGEWSGQLGDGRAVMLGDYVNRKGERWELQLKGSGKTPYSRHGDGRAVLRSSIREFLASEAMHYLGIPTSRAASIVVSNDPLWRDMFYDGHPKQEKAAVVLRVAKSWFRIGSLEILTERGEIELLRKLVDFIIEQHFEDIKDDNNKYLNFFSKVVTMTSDMIAQWQSVGFVHGVCNTDNFSLLSITIDYGPFGFLDEYDKDFIPNSSDDEGRYSFRNQPSIGLFNLEKLLDAMSPILNRKKAQKVLVQYSDIFNNRFGKLVFFAVDIATLFHVVRHFEFDYRTQTAERPELIYGLSNIAGFHILMESSHADFTMTFRQLGDLSRYDMKNGTLPEEAWALKKLAKHKNWFDWLQRYHERLDRLLWQRRNTNYEGLNPRYVLRNWMAQSAIDKADVGDFTEVRTTTTSTPKPWGEPVFLAPPSTATIGK